MADVILGIDPGSRNTGYAILTEEDNKLVALRCDVLKMAHMDDHLRSVTVYFRGSIKNNFLI